MKSSNVYIFIFCLHQNVLVGGEQKIKTNAMNTKDTIDMTFNTNKIINQSTQLSIHCKDEKRKNNLSHAT